MFLATLAQMCGRTGIRVHSYVLMSNHYHLLLETPEANLVAGLKWFQGTYTQRCNARHRLSSHLFQGRYRAIPGQAEAEGYFCAASEDLHLNAVRARRLAAGRPDLLEERWSSFPRFVQKARLPDWLRRERVFGALELPDEGSRIAPTLPRMAGGADARCPGAGGISEGEAGRWRELRRGWYLGSESSGDRLVDWAAVAGRKRVSYSGESPRGYDQSEAEWLLVLGLERLGLTLRRSLR